MKPELGAVQETMLIPLVIKANETMRSHARIRDPKAVEILRSLQIDGEKYDKFMSHEGVVARTIMFDNMVKLYLERYPDAVCINLGCGLDARFGRVDNGRILWYDIDLPDTVFVRKQFFEDTDRVHTIAWSILEPDWTDMIEKGRKIILIAEGLFMYFSREQLQTLLSVLKNAFGEFILLAELMSPLAAKGSRHHDTVKNTNASFCWGTKNGHELEPLCSGLKLVREDSFNVVMKHYSLRGWLFATIPGIRNLNDRLAVYECG